MPDRCFWCTDPDGKTAVNFAVVEAKRPEQYVHPVFIKYCPFCGRKVVVDDG